MLRLRNDYRGALESCRAIHRFQFLTMVFCAWAFASECTDPGQPWEFLLPGLCKAIKALDFARAWYFKVYDVARSALRADKVAFYTGLAEQGANAFANGDMATTFSIIRKLQPSRPQHLVQILEKMAPLFALLPGLG